MLGASWGLQGTGVPSREPLRCGRGLLLELPIPKRTVVPCLLGPLVTAGAGVPRPADASDPCDLVPRGLALSLAGFPECWRCKRDKGLCACHV